LRIRDALLDDQTDLQRILTDISLSSDFLNGREHLDLSPFVSKLRNPSSNDEFGSLIVAHQETSDEIVGACGVHNGFIFYFISPPFWGQRVCSTLVEEICRRAFLANVHTLGAFVRRDNIASIKCLERHKFSFSGLDTSSCPTLLVFRRCKQYS